MRFILDIANKHEDELKKLFMETWYDEKYKFYHNGCFSQSYKASDSSWEGHEFVSINKENQIIGYIGYNIVRQDDRVDGLNIINFTDDIVTFGYDLRKVLRDIFEKFHFRKLSFNVVSGNPIEKSYDKLAQKYGGRIIGIEREHVKLIDNKYYDFKNYEILMDAYMSSINKKGE